MSNEIKKNWWENNKLDFEQVMRLNEWAVIDAMLAESLNRRDKKIINSSFYGSLKDISVDNFKKLLTDKLDLNPVLLIKNNGIENCEYFVSSDTVITVSQNGERVGSVTNSIEKNSIVEDICKKFLKTKSEERGAVNVLVQGPNGLYLSTIGVGGLPLEEQNYMPEVINKYKKVIKDVNSKVPDGRITILTGAPGTGKTHIIRGLLHDCTNTSFIFIPSFMVSNLSGPQLIPILANEAEEGKPIVIVIEDADNCIVKRGQDNMSEVSTLLNLGDGILGSILDIRIVATTNAKKLDVDDALTRDGRLSQFIEVGKLSTVHANNLISKMLKKDSVEETFFAETTLATVYSKAKNLGWTSND